MKSEKVTVKKVGEAFIITSVQHSSGGRVNTLRLEQPCISAGMKRLLQRAAVRLSDSEDQDAREFAEFARVRLEQEEMLDGLARVAKRGRK